MTDSKKAIIWGCTGQDGSYLAELLLGEGFTVVGVTRRVSTDNTQRIQHLLENKKFVLESGDITDAHSVFNILKKHEDVDHVYNLAAQSHVAVSFKQPGLTWDITGKGCLNILQTIVDLGLLHVRFYQASSSEMFGASYDVDADTDVKYQNENTKFLPQSPYAIAKCAAHYMTRLYREGYGVHASAGTLFNHETVTYSTPLLVKIDGKIDILPIGDIARFKSGLNFNMNGGYQEGEPTKDIEVWDRDGWTKVKFVSGYPHKEQKSPRIINARNFVYSATGSHVCFMEDGSEKETKDIKIGDRVLEVAYPGANKDEEVSLEEAEFLGMLVGDGSMTTSNGGTPRLTNKDASLRQRFSELWEIISNGGSSRYHYSTSGFTGEEVGQVVCRNVSSYKKDFDVYTGDISPFGHKNKKVPVSILNSSPEVMKAFLIGYNNCDGLKKNVCTYQFKNFKTNSQTLAAGLLYLVSQTTKQRYNITVEESWKWGEQQFYYSINLLTDRVTATEKFRIVNSLLKTNTPKRVISRQTGISRKFIQKVAKGYSPENTHHLELPSNEVKKIIEIPNYDGWFFDLETESGTFHAGVGNGLIHNSPRRGDTFVTKKITKWIGEFRRWLGSEERVACDEDMIYKSNGTFIEDEFPKLRLGNLDSYRDWGHAKDYVRAMYMMLNKDYPDDYVICTGETHSVREFLDIAFKEVGISVWEPYVVIDPEFYRPAEVDYLRGDNSKAKNVLGWEPEHSFEYLVSEMVEHDLEYAFGK